MAQGKNVVIGILVAIIVVLAAILLWFFVVSPAITGYAIDRQTEGAQIAVNAILTQIQQNGFVQIPIGVDEEGQQQTLVLVPYVPQQPTQVAESEAVIG
jgi:hypothetical protein